LVRSPGHGTGNQKNPGSVQEEGSPNPRGGRGGPGGGTSPAGAVFVGSDIGWQGLGRDGPACAGAGGGGGRQGGRHRGPFPRGKPANQPENRGELGQGHCSRGGGRYHWRTGQGRWEGRAGQMKTGGITTKRGNVEMLRGGAGLGARAGHFGAAGGGKVWPGARRALPKGFGGPVGRKRGHKQQWPGGGGGKLLLTKRLHFSRFFSKRTVFCCPPGVGRGPFLHGRAFRGGRGAADHPERQGWGGTVGGRQKLGGALTRGGIPWVSTTFRGDAGKGSGLGGGGGGGTKKRNLPP